MAISETDAWWIDKWTVKTVKNVEGDIDLEKNKSKFRIKNDGDKWTLKVRKKMKRWSPKEINLEDKGFGVAERFEGTFTLEGEGEHIVKLTALTEKDEIEMLIRESAGTGGTGRGSAGAGRG